jgi:hypothetical protein
MLAGSSLEILAIEAECETDMIVFPQKIFRETGNRRAMNHSPEG